MSPPSKAIEFTDSDSDSDTESMTPPYQQSCPDKLESMKASVAAESEADSDAEPKQTPVAPDSDDESDIDLMILKEKVAAASIEDEVDESVVYVKIDADTKLQYFKGSNEFLTLTEEHVIPLPAGIRAKIYGKPFVLLPKAVEDPTNSPVITDPKDISFELKKETVVKIGKNEFDLDEDKQVWLPSDCSFTVLAGTILQHEGTPLCMPQPVDHPGQLDY